MLQLYEGRGIETNDCLESEAYDKCIDLRICRPILSGLYIYKCKALYFELQIVVVKTKGRFPKSSEPLCAISHVHRRVICGCLMVMLTTCSECIAFARNRSSADLQCFLVIGNAQ